MQKRNISDEVIKEFTLKVKKKLGSQIIQIPLLGSRTRGDNLLNSDYDFLIIGKK